MKSPSIDICWRIAEAEAALAGFPVIEPAHFWIGVCKAVDLDLSALLDAPAPEHRKFPGNMRCRFHSRLNLGRKYATMLDSFLTASWMWVFSWNPASG